MGTSRQVDTGRAGSQTCQACHAHTYESWRNTLHANMIRPASNGDLGNARADLAVEGAPRPDQYEWAFVIGGWYKEERYAYRDAEGTIKTGEFEYNVPRRSFTLRKNRDGNPEAHGEERASCASCHLPKLIGSGSVSTHTFEAIPPSKTLELGPSMANSCTGTCHKNWSAEEADARFKAIFRR